jgi:hypothetical protein
MPFLLEAVGVRVPVRNIETCILQRPSVCCALAANENCDTSIFSRSFFNSSLVVNLLRHYATSRKVAGTIPDEVTGTFSIDLILAAALWPWS